MNMLRPPYIEKACIEVVPKTVDTRSHCKIGHATQKCGDGVAHTRACAFVDKILVGHACT